MDMERVLIEIEDYLFPQLQLNVLERSMYYYMLRHTRLVGKVTGIFPLVPAATALGVSEWSVRDRIRSLNDKGCIAIEERGKNGHVVKVFLPDEIPGIVHSESDECGNIDVESVDFFRERKYLQSLLLRENEQCFYCLRKTGAENCALDHIVPQMNGGDNSYRNIVVSCHECNSKKQGQSAEDYLRSLYRSNLLSQAEFEERKGALTSVKAGQAIPII